MANRWLVAPGLRVGFGPLIGNPVTSYMMLLRTRGRRTGLRREVPLGYVIEDGCVFCVAGYGAHTPWYLNLLADPEVEVVLPGRTIRGRAEPVVDAATWLDAYRALIASFGLVGRLVVSDPSQLDDATLLATHGSLPVIRIRPADPRVAAPGRSTRAATVDRHEPGGARLALGPWPAARRSTGGAGGAPGGAATWRPNQP
jgi:deazaflavin-dependent oxidoreductase (nitroreductase family)